MMDSGEETMGSVLGNGRRALAEEVPVGYKRTEVGVIPENWQVEGVSEFGSIVTGGTPSTLVRQYWNGHHPWVTPTDISSARDIYLSDRSITDTGLSSIRRLPPDTVLVTCIASIGKNAILRVLGGCNQQINAVVPNNQHCADYLYYVFENAKSYLLGNAGITATPILSKALFRNLIFPVPPLPEQRAIAEALSDVDELLAALEALIAKKRAVKQAAIQQLLTGKSRLPGFSKDEDWGVLELRELCTHIVDGTHYTPKYVPYGIPFYSVENVTADDFTDVKYISESEHNLLIRRCNPQRGDILLTRIGSLGDTKLIDWDVNASIYVSLALLKLGKCADPEYIYHYTKSFQFTWEVESRSLVNAIPKKINMGDIGAIPIRIPPTESEQRAIANILSDMDAEIAALERRRDKTRAVKQSMMQQLLSGRVRLVEPEALTKTTT
ncbi:MAG: restriction endonuclease subunit S [Gemmatimonadota bacterium]|nr:restriction endonuclease subunit S [Gemmatimonadota bacterium]